METVQRTDLKPVSTKSVFCTIAASICWTNPLKHGVDIHQSSVQRHLQHTAPPRYTRYFQLKNKFTSIWNTKQVKVSPLPHRPIKVKKEQDLWSQLHDGRRETDPKYDWQPSYSRSKTEGLPWSIGRNVEVFNVFCNLATSQAWGKRSANEVMLAQKMHPVDKV